MFSLIITVVSIALVAALALATLYYGRAVAEDGVSSAKAVRVVNAGEQVMGALSLYYAEHGSYPPTLDALVSDHYLRTMPELALAEPASSLGIIPTAYAAPVTTGHWTYDSATGYVAYASPALTPNVCAKVNWHVARKDLVLNTLDTGATAATQCVSDQSGLKVVFRSKVPGNIWNTYCPTVMANGKCADGVLEGTAAAIEAGTYNESSGVCVFNCKPAGTGTAAPSTPSGTGVVVVELRAGYPADRLYEEVYGMPPEGSALTSFRVLGVQPQCPPGGTAAAPGVDQPYGFDEYTWDEAYVPENSGILRTVCLPLSGAPSAASFVQRSGGNETLEAEVGATPRISQASSSANTEIWVENTHTGEQYLLQAVSLWNYPESGYRHVEVNVLGGPLFWKWYNGE